MLLRQPRLISILVPTHNRCDVLLRMLESLRGLEIPAGFQCELVVVANACTDGTVRCVKNWGLNAPFEVRVVEETCVGLGHARNRSLAEARGEILILTDDDIRVDPFWLSGLLEVFNTTAADIVAGRVELWWESVAKPSWLTYRTAHLLSCVDYGNHVKELFSGGQAISCNLAFRRCVLANVPAFRTDLGRSGKGLTGGEETEFLTRALAAGHRMFYAPRGLVHHWVAPYRISRNYLGEVAFGNGVARVWMKKPFTKRSAIAEILEQGNRVAVYSIGELLSLLIGDKTNAMNHFVRRMTSAGALAGVRQRLAAGKAGEGFQQVSPAQLDCKHHS